MTPEGPKRHEIGNEPVTIGRHRDNAVMIEDDHASRFHCVVEPVKGGFRVRDLDSKNGTRLNDDKITQAPLSAGDVIRIGALAIHFVSDSAAAVTDAANPLKGARTVKDALHPPDHKPIKRSPVKDRRDEPKKPRKPQGGSILDAPMSSGGNNPFEALAGIESDGSGDPVPLAGGDGDEPVSLQAAAESISEFSAMMDSIDADNLTESDVQLVNSRGEVVHDGVSRKSKKGEVDDAGEGARVLKMLVLTCMRTKATDVHVEPKQAEALVRLRVDGMMVEAMRLDRINCQRLISVVKVMADIDISQRNIIQEGHFSSKVRTRHIDYRVSLTPSMHGQKLVIRVLDLANAPTNVTDLAMPDWMLQHVRKVAKSDAGAVLVAGPTGSGKTTTLYAMLRDVDVEKRNVITIEDPVEYELTGVTQLPIDELKGNTFATLLRSVLRQDPDVILLGEIRDTETATTAMQAAMTGHLVLSTVHAKDTIGTLFRLLDLGIESYLVAQSLNLVIAQRLIRMLCPHCKEPKKPTPTEQMKLGKTVEGVKQIYLPVGCPHCLNTGYAGRRGIYEMLIITDDLRDALIKSPTMDHIRKSIKANNFISLRDAGYRMVLDGTTSMEEVERVVGGD
jgi:type II secretory ATPase GspE/PulE/Tfp pilus assembly ATPase PilB-like protein